MNIGKRDSGEFRFSHDSGESYVSGDSDEPGDSDESGKGVSRQRVT